MRNNIQSNCKILQTIGNTNLLELRKIVPAESAVLSGGQTGAHGIEGVGAGFVVPLWNELFLGSALSMQDQGGRIS